METKFNIGETVYVIPDIHHNVKHELYKFKIEEIKISKNKILYRDNGCNFFPESLMGRTIDEAKNNTIETLNKELCASYEEIYSLKLKKR